MGILILVRLNPICRFFKGKSKHCGCISFSIAAYFFNRERGWTQVPNMRNARRHPICGLATNKDGKRHLLVGGGYKLTDFQSLDMETLEWRNEEKASLSFFTNLTYATTVVPYGRSFLVLGGWQNGAVPDSKDIYSASNFIISFF